MSVSVSECGADSFVSFGKTIRGSMHEIYIISTASPNLEAAKFIELTFLRVFSSPSVSLCGWQLSRTVHRKALRREVSRGSEDRRNMFFFKSQHLLYLTMIWFSLHGNWSRIFLPTSNPSEVVQLVVSEEEGRAPRVRSH